jgi:hypothetical protein
MLSIGGAVVLTLDGQIFGNLVHVHPQGSNLPQTEVRTWGEIIKYWVVRHCCRNVKSWLAPQVSQNAKSKLVEPALIAVGAKTKAESFEIN